MSSYLSVPAPLGTGNWRERESQLWAETQIKDGIRAANQTGWLADWLAGEVVEHTGIVFVYAFIETL